MTNPAGVRVSDIIKNNNNNSTVNISFKQNENSQFVRKDGNLYEVMHNKQMLKINPDGSKTKYSNDRKEVCYNNQKGYVFNTKLRKTQMCNCRNQIVDEWSCRLSIGYNYVKKVLDLENVSSKNLLNNEKEYFNQTKDI